MKKYRVVVYMRIEPEEEELLTLNEAIKEVAQLNLMQPENIYDIEGFNEEEK